MLISSNQIYVMNDSRKGRACIISLPTFEHPDLPELHGYREDVHQLGQLFEQMGFEVYLPIIRADRSLTAQVNNILKSKSGNMQITQTKFRNNNNKIPLVLKVYIWTHQI